MPTPTPQQALFEKLYRETPSGQRPLSQQQSSLQRSFNKYSSKTTANSNALKGSKAVQARSTLRATKAKVSSQGKSFAKKVSSSATKGKVSSAKNISKFGGGVAKRFGGTLSAIKTKAVGAGISKQGLRVAVGRFGGKKLASLGLGAKSGAFLAPIATVPGIALVAVAEAVWSDNIKKIKDLYDIDPISPTLVYPPNRASRATAQAPVAGQDPNGVYRVTSKIRYVRTFGGEGIRDFTIGVRGQITNVFMGSDGRPYVEHILPGDTEKTYRYLGENRSEKEYLEIISTSIEKLNSETGEYDPETDKFQPPADTTTDPTDSNNTSPVPPVVNNYHTTNNYYSNTPPVPPTPTPPKSKAPTTKPPEKETTPPPSVVPTVDASTPVISRPDAPPEVAKVPTPDPIRQKPKRPGTKTTRYPTERELQDINEVIQKNRDKRSLKIDFDADITPITRSGLPSIGESQQQNHNSIIDQYDLQTDGATEIVTKTVQPVKPTIETTEDTEFKIPPIPGRLINKPSVDVETKTPDPPTATKLSPCSKGCGGSTPTPTPLPNNTNLLSGVNDLLIQNPLLAKIDATTTATKGVVTNANFGLEKIQGFAETAWKATKADKILNGITTAMVIHNGVMLSGNLAQTIGDVASVSLQAVGIKDEEDNPIDVNSFIKAKLDQMITSFILPSHQKIKQLVRK